MTISASYSILLRLQSASGSSTHSSASLIRLGGQMFGAGHLGRSSCSSCRSMASAACLQLRVGPRQGPGAACTFSTFPKLHASICSQAARHSKRLPSSNSWLAQAQKHTASEGDTPTAANIKQGGQSTRSKVQPLQLLGRAELEALRRGQQPQQQKSDAQTQQRSQQALPSRQQPSQLPVGPTQQEVLAHLKSLQQQQTGPALLDQQQLANVAQYLAELNQEQWDAVRHPAQHLRLIAGPGSGKTRTMAARVAYLIATGQAEPHEILAITFTRKAAGELVERMEALMGRKIMTQLKPRTFHSLCNKLLRQHQNVLGMEEFTLVDDDDIEDIIRDIVLPEAQADKKPGKGSSGAKHKGRQQALAESEVMHSSKSNSKSSSSTRDSKKSSPVHLMIQSVSKDRSNRSIIAIFQDAINKLKSFTRCIEGRSGVELLSEVKQSGLRLIAPDFEPAVAAVYDQYQERLLADNLLDFDDLLHRCLGLLQKDPRIRAALHSQYKHVLVDESQDTNYCQFELVTTITGARSTLFMVGDPDQGIYGFRGANSTLLTDVFLNHYHGTADTLFLSRNYRSRPPIVHAADVVRRQLMLPSAHFQAGDPIRRSDSDETVILLEAENNFRETDAMVTQLRKWHRSGYVWGEMALLFRTREAARDVYNALVREDIPAHMPLGKGFWESAEVKTAMAFIRCLTGPYAAGEVIKRRLVDKGGISVPIMRDLGVATFNKLNRYIIENPEAVSNDNGTDPEQQQQTLGRCLLGNCFEDEMSQETASLVLEQWLSAAAVATDGSSRHSSPSLSKLSSLVFTSKSEEVLEQLASPWQPPAGLKGINAKMQAAINRLRGLVLLGRAVAELYPPKYVLQALLAASGVLSQLKASAALGADSPDKAKDARRRMTNLGVLLDLADNGRIYEVQNDAVLQIEGVDSTSDSDAEDKGGAAAAAANVSLVAATAWQQPEPGMPFLRAFHDACVLRGEGDEDDEATQRKVQLLTMHSSKGKEYPCVGVMRVYQGHVPFIMVNDTTPNALEQERNLLYVAMTRAKDHLVVSWPKCMKRYHGGRGSTEMVEISQFIKPLLARCSADSLPGVRQQKLRY